MAIGQAESADTVYPYPEMHSLWFDTFNDYICKVNYFKKTI